MPVALLKSSSRKSGLRGEGGSGHTCGSRFGMRTGERLSVLSVSCDPSRGAEGSEMAPLPLNLGEEWGSPPFSRSFILFRALGSSNCRERREF